MTECAVCGETDDLVAMSDEPDTWVCRDTEACVMRWIAIVKRRRMKLRHYDPDTRTETRSG